MRCEGRSNSAVNSTTAALKRAIEGRGGGEGSGMMNEADEEEMTDQRNTLAKRKPMKCTRVGHTEDEDYKVDGIERDCEGDK